MLGLCRKTCLNPLAIHMLHHFFVQKVQLLLQLQINRFWLSIGKAIPTNFLHRHGFGDAAVGKCSLIPHTNRHKVQAVMPFHLCNSSYWEAFTASFTSPNVIPKILAGKTCNVASDTRLCLNLIHKRRQWPFLTVMPGKEEPQSYFILEWPMPKWEL